VNVSNVFIPKGEMVVTTKGKVVDWDRSFKTINKVVEKDLPLVLLIDGNSASASEIVCGVIQDLDRGVLVGQQSYGKGLVQNTRDVGYNSKVKLTTAKYYIPSGRCIQGVSYEDGEPVDIPDAERTIFKTRNGRSVLDGGGVRPDVIINEDTDAQLVRSLQERYVIFNYATEYCLKHPKTPDISTFQFEDYDDFVRFVAEQGLVFNTKSEQQLEEFVAQANREGLESVVTSQVKDLKQAMKDQKKRDLMRYKEVIVDLIEKEVISRFHFQKGKIQVGLRNDKEIKEAISLLKDGDRYRTVLSQK